MENLGAGLVKLLHEIFIVKFDCDEGAKFISNVKRRLPLKTREI
jgi:hypothetical protein